MTRDNHALAIAIVREFLGVRLREADEVPGLTASTIRLIEESLADPVFDEHMRLQIELLRSGHRNGIPDAYLADEAIAENALQRAAAGVRSAAAQAGLLVNPEQFEQAMAQRVTSDPTLAIRCELARIPRPSTRPDALAWSRQPMPWLDDDTNDVAVPFTPPAMPRTLDGGADALARVQGGPHDGWVQIALAERQHTSASTYPDRPSERTSVMVGLGVGGAPEQPSQSPFTHGYWQVWVYRDDSTVEAAAAIADQEMASHVSPLVGVAGIRGGEMLIRSAGPGLPAFVLAPIPALAFMLELEPTRGIAGLSLSDGRGPGLIGRHWRGYNVDDRNQEPAQPGVQGTDVIIRPDLLDRVVTAAGRDRVAVGLSTSHSQGDDDQSETEPHD